jgi:hypothetical protein
MAAIRRGINPFRLSGAVTGDDFANREAERANVREALTQKQHYALVYGPRRMGKTSTLRVVQNELRAKGEISPRHRPPRT